MATKRKLTLDRTLPYILVLGSIIGALCASILTIEKMELLKNPKAQLGCDLNPIVACGSVINTHQASAFGFPNPIIGMIGFGALAMVGAGLLTGGTFKRWYWLGVQVGVTFGVVFITWLQFETIFRIHAICPFCMVVWSVMIPMFLYTTLYNLGENHIKVPAALKGLVIFARRHHGDILVAWFLIIFGIILKQFWYYWQTLI